MDSLEASSGAGSAPVCRKSPTLVFASVAAVSRMPLSTWSIKAVSRPR